MRILPLRPPEHVASLPNMTLMTPVTRILLPALVALFVAACQGIRQDEATGTHPDPEKHRPQFHFSPPGMWMNDPNGMVYHNGEYHLFYQHYPDSTVWGPMHWGHAVSENLVHWEHLPIALYPDSLGYIFSGSAVVDSNNTSGFGTSDNPPLVAVFTYHSDEKRRAGRKDFQTQGIAFSTDNGRTWTKYDGNPVLKNPGIEDFRDPKVFWHQESKKWVMVLAVLDHVELYHSSDLKSWNKLSEFGKTEGAHGGVWECPDLFPLTIEGTQKWVMLVSINPGGVHGGSATQYFVGDFNGRTFTNDNPSPTALWVDYGKDNYAGVTWANIPEQDGRRIFLGWMSNWQYANTVPTQTWRSAMTLPRTLHLENTTEGIRLASRPVTELDNIRKESFELQPEVLQGPKEVTDIPFEISTSELLLEFDMPDKNTTIGVSLSNDKGEKLIVGYDAAQKKFYIDRTNAGISDFSDDFSGIHYAPRITANESVKLHVFLDVASAELFADDGTAVITDVFFPTDVLTKVIIFSHGGTAKLKGGRIRRVGR